MSVQDKEIEEYIRNLAEAINSRDIAFLEAVDAGRVGGFGWKSSAWRENSAGFKINYKQFFETFEHYTTDYPEIHTWSDGNIGLAWGICTESLQRKGDQPHKARMRFTFTLRKDSNGWHELMYHRDIQPFNEDGRWLAELTRVNE